MSRRCRTSAFFASIAIALSASLSAPVFAAAPKVIGTHQDWQSYLLVEGKSRVCYMASQPQKKEPAAAKRGDVLVFVTHRPADKEQNVVNFHAGYTLKPDTDVHVVIGDSSFDLFTKGDTAWTRGTKDDKAMVDEMMKGSTMTVTGESDRGTKTVDTYSLRGFTAAYKDINKACGIK
jgi:invasion protein IalB